MNSNKKHYIIYKTTNLLNNKIYIGQHQTNNLDDGYFGSGYNIKKAVAKHGIQNFDTCVLFNFDSFEEMNNKEIELVNEAFIKREDTYNLVIGGTIDNTNMIVVVNNYGNKFRISKDDPRYISGELVGHTKGNILTKDSLGNKFYVSKDDPRYISGELVGIAKNKVIVKDINGNKFQVSKDDPRYISGELVGHTKGNLAVKDSLGNKFHVSKDDPRYISGELVTITNSNKFRTPYGDFNSGKHFCTWCIDNKGITFNVSTVNAMLSRRNKKFKFKSIILDSLNIIDYKGKTARDLGWYLLINN